MTVLGKAGLVYLLLTGLLVGLWAQVWPRGFYDSFPGSGFAWVSLDGPYNEHLVRDVGGLNLALALLAGLALREARLQRPVGLAFLLYAIPHFIYHLVHVGMLPTTLEQILQTLSLGLALLAALILLLPVWARDQMMGSVR